MVLGSRKQTIKGNANPEMPSRITYALYMLFLSLCIGVMRVAGIWFLTGYPGFFGCFFIGIVLSSIVPFFHAPLWLSRGEFIILPLAVWLYCMIAKGRNWARITLLIFSIPQALSAMLFVFAGLVHMRHHPAVPGLLGFLFSTELYAVQSGLQILAVGMLFGQVSSEWFMTMKTRR